MCFLDPLPRPFVFIVDRRIEVCGDDAFGDGAADDAAFEQITGVVERGTEKGGNWKSEMLVNTGGVDDIRVFAWRITMICMEIRSRIFVVKNSLGISMASFSAA